MRAQLFSSYTALAPGGAPQRLVILPLQLWAVPGSGSLLFSDNRVGCSEVDCTGFGLVPPKAARFILLGPDAASVGEVWFFTTGVCEGFGCWPAATSPMSRMGRRTCRAPMLLWPLCSATSCCGGWVFAPLSTNPGPVRPCYALEWDDGRPTLCTCTCTCLWFALLIVVAAAAAAAAAVAAAAAAAIVVVVVVGLNCKPRP